MAGARIFYVTRTRAYAVTEKQSNNGNQLSTLVEESHFYHVAFFFVVVSHQ